MGGIFGSLLGIVEAIGGVVLTILIGQSAACKKNGLAEFIRLLLGSVIISSIMGLLTSFIKGGDIIMIIFLYTIFISTVILILLIIKKQ